MMQALQWEQRCIIIMRLGTMHGVDAGGRPSHGDARAAQDCQRAARRRRPHIGPEGARATTERAARTVRELAC